MYPVLPFFSCLAPHLFIIISFSFLLSLSNSFFLFKYVLQRPGLSFENVFRDFATFYVVNGNVVWPHLEQEENSYESWFFKILCPSRFFLNLYFLMLNCWSNKQSRRTRVQGGGEIWKDDKQNEDTTVKLEEQIGMVIISPVLSLLPRVILLLRPTIQRVFFFPR